MPDDSRDELELQKLRAEIASANATAREMSRSDMSRPTLWIGIATAVVAVLGVGVQAYLSNNEYVLASIQKAQAELDTNVALADRGRLQTQLAALKGELERLDSDQIFG
jgi:hypothetical protein